jgi:tetratricopeptide (TPR) repeat protein
MSSKRLSKQEMREDQFRDFLSEFYFGAIRSVEEHWQRYLVGLVVVLAAIAGGFFLANRMKEQRDHGSYLLGRVMEAYDAPVSDTPNPNSSRLSFTSESAKTQEVATRLAAMEKAKGAGDSGRLAAVYQALSLAQAGKYAEAEKALGPVAADKNLAPVALLMRAKLREAQGQWDQAEQDYKSLCAAKSPSWLDAEGWWLLGGFYERRNQNEKALAAYEMVSKSLGPEAGEDNALAKRAKDQMETLKGKA